ncbi:SpoIIAA family protein [Plastoroseomonas hellenica]|uniref:STAS/SEC14 domain-containing protein n=1 Tax=Plastoroseomonas hellenica TaxID=2687306 RepID=A0ABS5EYY0_9PROT|nr:STAS/SEC14 domain-containing protein [Plastoroseomonas hellenica]MBR0646099.1 STAS/SEC14 domain-containing protein [Plastoroseomonas hellenica]MBR0665494.1 STAS/SEC14 domain-containing protein [Plastoroseomonas hellenica]
MIEILPAPDHVFAARMAGTLTGEDFDRMASEIEAKLKRHDRIGVFVDATGFDDMTGEAAAKDLSYSFGKLRDWHRFPREAVVTDKQWMRSLITLVDPLIPQVEVRSFTPAERGQALAWASDVQPH